MKKIIIAISFLAITAAAFAGGSKKNLSPETHLESFIQNSIVYPQFMNDRAKAQTAELDINVKPDGHLTVTDVKCSDPDLKENIMYQALSLTVNPKGLDPNETYKIMLHFTASL